MTDSTAETVHDITALLEGLIASGNDGILVATWEVSAKEVTHCHYQRDEYEQECASRTMQGRPVKSRMIVVRGGK